jgi:hypothetical protein
MVKLKLITLLLLLSANIFSQNTDDIVIAKRIKIQSTVLNEERTIFVSTPLNYNQSIDAYPVMYVLDGSENSIHFNSGLVSNLSERALCPKMIIVAISNTDRFRDMTPTPYTRDPNRPSGGADKFLQFMETELFPFIEKEYRTLPYRIIKGHSASGLCVTHAFLSHNQMFNSYIAISPSMWWDSNLFSKTAEEKLGEMNFKHKHFYFSTGSKETAHNIDGAQSFYEVLSEKNPKDLKWKFDHIQDEDHMSQGTIAMYNALRFIYADWKFDAQKLRSDGLSYLDDFCKKQTEIYGYEISPSEAEMTSIGYMILRQRKYSEAIEIFKRNIHNNPLSANAYDCLGEAYLACEKFDLSIENYEKAVSLGITNKDENLEFYEQNLEKAKGLKEYYFNQPSPGDSAVIFSPGIFSLHDRLESNITFSPDDKEYYFGVIEIKDNKSTNKIYYTKYVNNKWTEQTEAAFSVNNNFGDPIMSVDGKKLYFSKDGDLWMVERTLEGWGEPEILPAPINSDFQDDSYSETTDGDVYISSKRPDGFGGIDIWRINNLPDKSLQAENLGPIINSKYLDYSPFIAPDGSYLIFGSYRGGADGLLYISFNKGNNEWTTPINMNSAGAKVNNSTAHHSNPSLSPDGKHLFFRRHANMMEMDVYWVSASIIESLRNKAELSNN